METARLTELLLQSLEHERGSAKVYQAAVECALNAGLEHELAKHLTETEHHLARLTQLISAFGIDPETQTPGRRLVAFLGESLLDTIRAAAEKGPPEAAELVACECVVFVQTKAYLDWELSAVPTSPTRHTANARG